MTGPTPLPVDLTALAPPVQHYTHATGDLKALLLDEANLLDWALQLAQQWPLIAAEIARLREITARRVALSPERIATLAALSFGHDVDLPTEAATLALGYLCRHERGPGWYAWLSEYPEEGVIAIDPPPGPDPCR